MAAGVAELGAQPLASCAKEICLCYSWSRPPWGSRGRIRTATFPGKSRAWSGPDPERDNICCVSQLGGTHDRILYSSFWGSNRERSRNEIRIGFRGVFWVRSAPSFEPDPFGGVLGPSLHREAADNLTEIHSLVSLFECLVGSSAELSRNSRRIGLQGQF